MNRLSITTTVVNRSLSAASSVIVFTCASGALSARSARRAEKFCDLFPGGGAANRTKTSPLIGA
eukprot:8150239-Pyramimonas_sp.AAC.1